MSSFLKPDKEKDGDDKLEDNKLDDDDNLIITLEEGNLSGLNPSKSPNSRIKLLVSEDQHNYSSEDENLVILNNTSQLATL